MGIYICACVCVNWTVWQYREISHPPTKMERTREGAAQFINSIKDVVPPKALFNVFIIPSGVDHWRPNGDTVGVGRSRERWGIVSDPSCNINLPHNTKYSVGVLNMSTHPIEATLNIDGKSMGVFYVDAYRFIDIKRSVYDDKCFIFKSVCETSPATNFAIENIASQFRGEVRVDIRPREHGINLYDHVRIFTPAYPSPEEDRRMQKHPRHISDSGGDDLRSKYYKGPALPYPYEADSAGAGDDVADTPAPPSPPPPPPTPVPTGGNIFTGLVETDFGGKSGPSAHAHAPAPPPPSTDRTSAGDLHTSSARPALANIRINSQGYTGFGEKTHQQFNQVQKMKTKGLHIFVNFLKLGDLEFNVLQDINMFT